MRSYHANLGDGIDGITMKEHQQAEPGFNEVRIQVRAASLNARDLMILRGHYTLPVKHNLIPLADGSGEIVAIGRGVTRAKVGDRVACAVFPKWLDGRFAWEYSAQMGGSLDGMLTESAIVSEEAVVHVPQHLSFEEAATLPCAAVTAWNALCGGRAPLPGESVLTLGSGGVSLFALQFAKSLGMRVICTTSNSYKATRLKALGADEVINYLEAPDWHEHVRAATGGRGVDHVIEVGGGGTLERSLKACAADAQVAIVGWLANQTTTIDVRAIAGGVMTMRRIALGSRAQFIAMNRAIALHKLRPVVDCVFDFGEAIAAFRSYAAGGSFGKIVVRI